MDKLKWVKSLQTILKDVIAIDGKTLCNSFDEACEMSAIHMVSAFATGARLKTIAMIEETQEK